MLRNQSSAGKLAIQEKVLSHHPSRTASTHPRPHSRIRKEITIESSTQGLTAWTVICTKRRKDAEWGKSHPRSFKARTGLSLWTSSVQLASISSSASLPLRAAIGNMPLKGAGASQTIKDGWACHYPHAVFRVLRTFVLSLGFAGRKDSQNDSKLRAYNTEALARAPRHWLYQACLALCPAPVDSRTGA